MGAANSPVQPDDNLVNGQTYTFTYDLSNLLLGPGNCVTPGCGSNVLAADISANAPDFVTSVVVTPLTSVTGSYAVQFTYEGDGSDVVADVGTSLAAAFLAGSGDVLNFNVAQSYAAPLQTNAQAITAAVSTVTNAAGSAIGSGIQQASSGIFSNLGTAGWVVVVLAVLVAIGYFASSTGLKYRGSEA